MSPDVPKYQPPPDDPQYLALKAQAEQDKTAAIQDRIGIDSASLMARYGARLTAANAAGPSPTPSAAAAPAPLGGTGGPFGTPEIMNAVFGTTKVA